MEEEKNSKQKPHSSFNRRLSVVKNQRGTWQRPRKMLKFLFYWEHGKGRNMAKGIMVVFFYLNYKTK